ncbi:MerR family transcriptional regulator [Bacillus pumilus]|uniref:MerR family transcriptional regulator n=1 Tax=Bacillus pumilus TaxID=1408 RepID=UPI0021119FA0|nr:MerR family transcriptional regulator [Bacillus pumilus]UUD44338.1 MerR family transcriptional regulator [Bacillus pumilus]
MELMTRGELSKRTGISAAAIRYYEENDISPVPIRHSNGYRLYTEDVLLKIEFIKGAKSLGYSLKEIKGIMGMLSDEVNPVTLREIVHHKLEEIEEKIKSLRFMQDLLSNLLKTSDKDIHEYLELFHVTKQDVKGAERK